MNYAANISPTTGPAGQAVTITARKDAPNFGDVAGSVSYNGDPCTVLAWADDEITVRLPLFAFKGYPLIVAKNGNTWTSVNYIVVPTIYSADEETVIGFMAYRGLSTSILPKVPQTRIRAAGGVYITQEGKFSIQGKPLRLTGYLEKLSWEAQNLLGAIKAGGAWYFNTGLDLYTGRFTSQGQWDDDPASGYEGLYPITVALAALDLIASESGHFDGVGTPQDPAGQAYWVSLMAGTGQINIWPRGKDSLRWQPRGDRTSAAAEGGYVHDEGAIHKSGREPVIDGQIADGDIARFLNYYEAGGSYLLTLFGGEAYKVEINKQTSTIEDNPERGYGNPAILRDCHLAFFVVDQVGPMSLVGPPGPYYMGRAIRFKVKIDGEEQDPADFEFTSSDEASACVTEEGEVNFQTAAQGEPTCVTLTVRRLSDNAEVELTICIQKAKPYSAFVLNTDECAAPREFTNEPADLFTGYDVALLMLALDTTVTLNFLNADNVSVPTAEWSDDASTWHPNPHTFINFIGKKAFLRTQPPPVTPPGAYKIRLTGAEVHEYDVNAPEVTSAAPDLPASLVMDAFSGAQLGPAQQAKISTIVYSVAVDSAGRTRYPDGSGVVFMGDKLPGDPVPGFLSEGRGLGDGFDWSISNGFTNVLADTLTLGSVATRPLLDSNGDAPTWLCTNADVGNAPYTIPIYVYRVPFNAMTGLNSTPIATGSVQLVAP